MSPLDLVRLTPLMDRTSGNPGITIGLIDGPVATHLPALAQATIREVPGKSGARCAQADSAACAHGTLVAATLIGKRGSGAQAICPGCTLLLRPIFAETVPGNGKMPAATPQELATAIIETAEAGARIINMSVGLLETTAKGEHALKQALDYAAGRGVVIVVAAGNQGSIGSSTITRHPWVIPVVAIDIEGRPTGYTNLGRTLGSRGLGAPGDKISSLGSDGKPQVFGGTSAATPFVTGAVALLWSEFPAARAAEIKVAITRSGGTRKKAIVPPLLDAWAAFKAMGSIWNGR